MAETKNRIVRKKAKIVSYKLRNASLNTEYQNSQFISSLTFFPELQNKKSEF